NGQRLLHLVNQMLDLSKLESGTLPLKLVQTDIIAYLRYIHESFHSFAEANEISLHFLTDEEQLIMDYDPDKILEIVSNLVSNAIKYTPEGGRVYLQVEEIINGDHPALQLKVIDTGIGIAEKDLSSIFDRFYQVDDSSTRKGEGTGIGLALARELAKLLGGHIEADSQPGKGTTFTVI
ncbi:MAG: hybrid sensor histidine kinase/response regulator, partial [Cyanobacteria bacterium HKST-UBA01]|nr:hybrid sensor histidine kinase/response regulator [Cyanobacteria bacterium HKST-UBA01]